MSKFNLFVNCLNQLFHYAFDNKDFESCKKLMKIVINLRETYSLPDEELERYSKGIKREFEELDRVVNVLQQL